MNKITKTNIWNFAQNKPTHVVNDICEKYPDVDPNFVYYTLLKRGIFKWLSVRRDIIKLKDKWKSEITRLNRKKTQKEIGYLKALEKCRADIRKLCHSDRFRAPDFDKNANTYLKSIK